MSASVRWRPGGHPSTMHPSAGPWLSPKLVTVKIRPNVFPATRSHSLQTCTSGQIRRSQYEHSPAAHRDVRPDEWQAGKGPHQRVLGVADFHDQNTVIDRKSVVIGRAH